MASPQLKKTAVVAPPRRLINSGVVPTTQVRLKGIGGQVIKPKAPVAPAKKKPTSPAEAAPVADETNEAATAATETAAATPEPIPAAAAAETPAPEPAPSAEPAPEPAPAEEAEPAPSAEDEAAAQAQMDYERELEEYNRQMEEYNRQMEEYNRQMAALAEQEEAAAAEAAAAAEEAPAAAPEPAPAEEAPAPSIADIQPIVAAPEPVSAPAPMAAPAPAAKLSVKKPALKGALKKKAAAPAAAAPAAAAEPATAEATEDTEAPQDIQDDYLAQLQFQSEATPIWKSKFFIIALSLVVIAAGVAVFVYMQKEAERAAVIASNKKVMSVLTRAYDINSERVETLADAKAKGINVSFTLEEANFLMDIVVNPEMKNELGKPMFGNRPEGSAELAVLGVSIACESNNDLCKVILDRMNTQAPQIKPKLYQWLLHRLAATNIKGLNSKLRKLADAVSENDTPNFRTRQELLSYIWESMVLRVTEKDVPTITQKLEDPDISDKLALALINCLENIVQRVEDPAKRAELGDSIFDKLSDTMRINASATLAISCSPKALDFFKKRVEDPKNLRTDVQYFSNYGSDDILPFLQELMLKESGDKKSELLVQNMINGLFTQRRERSEEQVKAFFAAIPAYNKVDMDTSDWEEINEKTDPDSLNYVEDPKQQEALKQRREELENSRSQKLNLIRQLSTMLDYNWVLSYLNKFAEENDRILSHEAKQAIEMVKKNREGDNLKKTKFNSRDKS